MSNQDNYQKPKGKQAPRLLSSINGKIQQILLSQSGFHTPWSNHRFAAIRKVYEEAGIEVFTLVNKQNQQPRFSLPETIDMENAELLDMLARGRQVEISTKINLSRWAEDLGTIASMGLQLAQSQWAQDAFCVQEYDEEFNLLLQPIYSKRIVDQFISSELALERNLKLFVKPTELQIEGGNILVGSNFAIIGLNTLGINWVEFLRSEIRKVESDREIQTYSDEAFLAMHLNSLKERFKAELGLEEIIWLGFPGPRMDLWGQQKYLTLQPVYHLDLFMTLGGKNKFGEEIVFLADPASGRKIAEDAVGKRINSGLVWEEIQVSNEFIASYFDEIEIFFRKYNETNGHARKFKIVRLPLLIEEGVAYSFNNALVEGYGAKKRAFLPNYIDHSNVWGKGSGRHDQMNEKMKALQENVESIMRENEFGELLWTGSGIHLQNFAARKGTLRCVSKVLRRAKST